MLTDAAAEWAIDLADSYLVGDRWRDVEAGQEAGCKICYFVDYGYRERHPKQPYVVVDSLAQATRLILADNNSSQEEHRQTNEQS